MHTFAHTYTSHIYTYTQIRTHTHTCRLLVLQSFNGDVPSSRLTYFCVRLNIHTQRTYTHTHQIVHTLKHIGYWYSDRLMAKFLLALCTSQQSKVSGLVLGFSRIYMWRRISCRYLLCAYVCVCMYVCVYVCVGVCVCVYESLRPFLHTHIGRVGVR